MEDLELTAIQDQRETLACQGNRKVKNIGKGFIKSQIILVSGNQVFKELRVIPEEMDWTDLLD